MRHRVVALDRFGRAARAIFCLAMACSLLCDGPAFAQPAASASAPVKAAPAAASPGAGAPIQEDAGAPADAAAPDSAATPEANPKLQELSILASRLRALVAGKLELDVDPKTLFDIELEDEEAIELERKRLTAIVDASSGEGQESDEASVARAVSKIPQELAASERAATKASPDAGTAAADAGALAQRELDPELWKARLAVDQARLALYRLPSDQRLQLLREHEKRQQEKLGSRQASAVSDAEQRAKSAGKQRQQALEAARRARTEAARLVVEERARLLGVAKSQAEFEAELLKQDAALGERQERLLGLERRVRETQKAVREGDQGVEALDSLYDTVAGALSEARQVLARTVARYIARSTSVPEPGENPLVDIPPEVETSEADEVRSELERTAGKLRTRELELREQRARQLRDEVQALNQQRLSLIPSLSRKKRLQVTNLGPQGLAEALGEAQQVALILQCHFGEIVNWLAEIRRPGEAREHSAMLAGMLLLKWSALVVVFSLWRRRADSVLGAALQELEAGRARSTRGPGRLERLVRYLRRVRSPLEWLILLWTMLALLPLGLMQLQEVMLARIIFKWTLGGVIVVHTIDFLVAQDGETFTRRSAFDTSHLRLRSLRLAGRVVVSLGLVLAVSNLLVGKGVIYGWVLNLIWLAAAVLGLVIVRWWRQIIFERVDHRRKKSRLEHWIVDHRTGLTSFPAAIVGALLLLAQGISRFVKNWIGGFELSRRVLAYLFRRELTKKAEDQARVATTPIDARLAAQLGPMTPSTDLVPSVADAQVAEVIERIKAPGGGVFAIVGERGSGKTTLLERITEDAPGVTLVDCPFGGMGRFAPAVLEALGADNDEQLEAAALKFDELDHNQGILIDDAHRLIRPAMGGLKSFDRVMEIARRCSRHTAWVFAFDSIIWQFFERMRGSRPLFDRVIRLVPWTDTGIANLISARTEVARLDVDFSPLLGDLPGDADEFDVQEALDRVELGYYRLIWDYADGNPGVALTVWSDSLALDPEGRPSVKVFQAPDADALEGLPDDAKFVLRAIVQLEHATADDINQATGVGMSTVEDALRYGHAHGYFSENKTGYSVTWRWFRAITRYLARHHLLVSAARTWE